MILSDGEIREELVRKNIEITGWEDVFIGPSSVDLHMGDKCKTLKRKDETIDLSKTKMDELFEETFIGVDGVTIYPNEFYLLSTVERIKFPNNIAGFVQGRSSLARLGIKVHDAGFVDPGFEGTITLEVTNMTHTPIHIPKFTRICQMVFVRCGKDAEIPYNKKWNSKYQGQNGPTVTRITKDYHD